MAWPEVTLWAAVVGGIAWIAVSLQRIRTIQRRLDRLPSLDDLQGAVTTVAAAERLRPLEESLRRMGDQLASLPAPAEVKDLLPLQERLEQLSRQLLELRLHVDELRAHAPAGADAVPIAPG